MSHPQVVDGGDGLQIWRVDANILMGSHRQLTNGGPPAWQGLAIPYCRRTSFLWSVRQGLRIRQIF